MKKKKGAETKMLSANYFYIHKLSMCPKNFLIIFFDVLIIYKLIPLICGEKKKKNVLTFPSREMETLQKNFFLNEYKCKSFPLNVSNKPILRD